MNIIIVGPGNDPERFGTHFVNKAIKEGHIVTKFSYRLQHESFQDIVKRFDKEIESLEKIDVFLYNSIGGFYPGAIKDYHHSHEVEYERWQEGILINAAIPHALSLKTTKKMDDNSSIVFMTSSASYLVNRDNYLELAGYFGTKSAMNHLARALAEYNISKAKVCVMAPHIPYEGDKEVCKKIMDILTDKILNICSEDNGKILQCYPPDGNIFYHEGGKQV